jgi:hypothetical protein
MGMDVLPLALILFALTFWLGGYLLARSRRSAYMQLAGWGLIAYALALALDVVASMSTAATLLAARMILAVVPAALWTLALVIVLRQDGGVEDGAAHRRPIGLLLLGALFFALSMAVLIADLVPKFWALVLIGIDLGLLGVALARLDAFDDGEAMGRDALRSLVGAGVMAALFGGAALLAAAANGGLTPPLLALTFVLIGLAIDVQLFAPQVQAWLDRLILPAQVQQQRAELRETGEALARADAVDLATLDDAEFARLTRRALSHMTDLPKLAASPLTRLPVVDRHLELHGMPDTPLDRAAALKAVLTLQIARLKPAGVSDAMDFGTTDAWRHYNALHFPYVVGLKPYSARAAANGHGTLAPADRAALAWFQSAVPERTLHNWQTTAARVIAQELQRSSGK